MHVTRYLCNRNSVARNPLYLCPVMKKVYEPQNMVMNGRYAVLYGKLSPELQQQVLARMAELIEEDKEYEDKGNYGHLCNILPTIAIDEVLQQSGKTADEAFEMISTHMWAALTPKMFLKMSKLPFFLSVMRKIIPLGFKYGSGKGWKYVWHPEDPKEYYHFETLECLYKHIFSKHGVLERFGPMFCHSDIINYGNLHNIDFIRTKTLCQGGDCCDICFVRHRKGEVWERTKSI